MSKPGLFLDSAEGVKLVGSLDVFNVFNSAGVFAVNARYGPQYLNPTSLLSPRLLRLSAQVEF